jgi:hypothetical protein
MANSQKNATGSKISARSSRALNNRHSLTSSDSNAAAANTASGASNPVHGQRISSFRRAP